MKCCGFFSRGKRPAAATSDWVILGQTSSMERPAAATSDGVPLGQTSSMESRHGTELVQGAIYEFHKPERMEVEIVFMHGLQVKAADLKDAYYKTWRTADGKEVWPQTWLKEKYPNARILSLAYDSSARQNRIAGNMGPYLLGESLLQQMVSTAGNIGQNDCPVVFVGHSLGGLIAKEIVVRCNSNRVNVKYQNLLRNLKAIFFYATPHGGSTLADSWITTTADLLRVKTSSLVEYLKPEATDRTHIHHDFLQAVHKNDCKFYVVAEGQAMKAFGNLSYMIVHENSARFPGLHDFVMHKDADHRTVCKPQSETDIGYLKLIDCINHVIEEYRRRITVHLSVDPIGIEDEINKISELLERSEVSIVGLFGMGGVGKTTLSKRFYNLNAFKYVKSCYLDNVKSNGVEDVQKELLRGLCGEQLDQGKGVDPKHVDMIKLCFQTQKVLVVIDDVSSEDCLRDLQVFHALETGSQSKVVVTGRIRTILPMKYVDAGKAIIEDVSGITGGYDFELFRQYAFDAIIPKADKEKAEIELRGEVEKIVKLCNGLPLSLEVLGKYLGNSKDKDEDLQQWKATWTDAYERLRKAQDIGGNESEKLWSSLRISYDHLGDLEKKMFLDYACILSKKTYFKRDAERIWGSPIGVKNLINKSLLKEQGRFLVMHDQLRDMGRHMLLKEAIDQHPIYLVEGRVHFFKSSAELVELKNLTTDSGMPCFASIGQGVEKSLRKYSKLRFFIVSECNTPSLVDDCLSQCSRDLIWLALHDCSGVTKIGIQRLFSFGGLRKLQIYSCDNIVELPEEIGKLINLVEMEVQRCSNLQSLPDTIGELKNLKKLVIKACKGLQVIPDRVGELYEVEHLSFEGCVNLKVIDSSQICTQKLMKLMLPIVPTTCLRPCPQLWRLDIGNARVVKEFPQDFFKTDMPKLEAVFWWPDPSRGKVVLKNPNGSELVLQSELFQYLQVHRQRNGSISRLSLVPVGASPLIERLSRLSLGPVGTSSLIEHLSRLSLELVGVSSLIKRLSRLN